MLADIDSAIHAWLTAELAPGTEIGFDPPGLLAGIQRRPRRAAIINAFLYAVSEDLDGMSSARIPVRSAHGKVTATRAPDRSYHLSYLITAWAADTAEEHELLGAVIGAHAEQDSLRPDVLRGALHELGAALPVRIGWAPRGGLDLWSALGVPMRTALDLTVTAPALPERLAPAAPPVEAVDLEVVDRHNPALTSRRRRERTSPEHRGSDA